MFTKEMLLEEITNRGYKAQLSEVVKNGVKLNAIVIKGETNCAPSIYIDEMMESANDKGLSVEEFASHVLQIAKEHIGVEFDAELIRDKAFVLSNLHIAIQKESTEAIIKRECGFEGLESYLYLKVKVNGSEGSIKMNERILEQSGTTEAEAWESAERNLHEETIVQPIFQVIGNMLGASAGGVDLEEESAGIYVISTKSMQFGASAILDKATIKSLAEKCKVDDFIVIPSSRHEMILVPNIGGVDFDNICDMVRQVNESTVAEVDRLTDRAYKLTA